MLTSLSYRFYRDRNRFGAPVLGKCRVTMTEILAEQPFKHWVKLLDEHLRFGPVRMSDKEEKKFVKETRRRGRKEKWRRNYHRSCTISLASQTLLFI